MRTQTGKVLDLVEDESYKVLSNYVSWEFSVQATGGAHAMNLWELFGFHDKINLQVHKLRHSVGLSTDFSEMPSCIDIQRKQSSFLPCT